MRRVIDPTSKAFASLDVDGKLLALAASAAQLAVEQGEGVLPENVDEVQEGSEFYIPLLIPEGVESGDGRKMDPDALTTRDLPLPLLWQPSTGDGHNGSFIVGRIDTIERVSNGLGNAKGVFDSGPYGREAERLVSAKMLRGVSADLDQFEATVDGQEMSGENFEEEITDKITSEKITVNKARVMAATLVPKPAFQECTIQLDAPEVLADEGIDMEDGVYEETPPEGEIEVALSTLAASAAPVTPPAKWMEDPVLDGPTPLTIDDDGRVFGHIATWDTDHIGFNTRVKPPRSRTGYAYFRTGLVRTDDGTDVPVGQLTLEGGHAPLDADASAAVRHYDETKSAVADVAAGEDQFGIWVAGALRPGVSPDQVRSLRASSPSGDWRPINNSLELVAVCQVNVPGFPVARARVASGAVMALVAAGTSTLHKIRHSEMDELSMRVQRLEAQLLEQKRQQLSARVSPIREARIKKLQEAASDARAIIAPVLEARAKREAELAARAEEVRAQFKLSVPEKFKEEKHPRDDDGKFKQVLLKLSEVLDGPGDNQPEAESAKTKLEEAVRLEESGDAEGAKSAAGEAAEQVESAAEKADTKDAVPGEGDDGAGSKVGDTLHKIAEDIAGAVGGAVEGADKAADAVKGGSDQIPEEFQELLEKIIDELGEGIDPRTIVSRMDGKLRQWLEGKGFQSPEDLARVVEKLMLRPLQPGITQ